MLRFRVYNLGLLFSVKDLGGYVCTLRFKVYGLGGVFFFSVKDLRGYVC